MVTICVIPARYGSTRFPGKPLAFLKNKPIIQHVYERAKSSKMIDEVFVATDDSRILHTVESFGGKAIMTSSKHPSGTDRIAEAVDKLLQEGYNLQESSIVINLQGDEPLIKKEMIDQLIDLMKNENDSIGTLAKRIEKEDDFFNPNIVKVVFDKNGYALYFSRSPIPFDREKFIKGFSKNNFMYKHIGIYGYNVRILKNFVGLPMSRLEEIESLEQLRALENGIKIKVGLTEYDSFGIDTPEDLEVAEKCLNTYS
ncbi:MULTISPECIES: 3-deoxy-manno-octulosonate cytidylyltransferase [Thermodesulfovibrio]|uniref:3-deoxy-manno-octulosonate cytidylyltransferase n=1 Tax=Thermodesulfovibrio yellowstonii (strain ATCC 51303 / DSM 11347 / YP87) TaxID=289376 RepID=KDSB_THEYD|nr:MULTISPECIES: 3-deoxy-manno-octulosonate cytidylyltransferase [Thermodesulfovibrio]B5YGT5.1 RecName: Full=3-deoxy-manno-octulosonate cytidylyltransferase; AltName: Full=CMP-2-keto-3-deoxyoctulosonic acid synthase; Short=CKS; Short=CMP-KDO synthase [Thermodesulfovibrio yellowstonii DSM 11347]ACI20451.1 3-deoxy-D-manno-octulosonate cytidylyltransferase [Thermodesulfovibrio yellowstonii DSM 11347]